RGEAQRGAAGAAGGQQQLVHDRVGAVGGPDGVRLGCRDPRLGGEVGAGVGAQGGRLPVRVAVQSGGGLGGGASDGLGELRRGAGGVLVDAQRVRDLERGSAGGGGPGER